MSESETAGQSKAIHRRRAAIGALLTAGVAVGGCARASAETPPQPSPAPASPDARVDALMSRWRIEEVLYAYTRGNDRNDLAMIRDCFWPESQHEHGGYKGSSHAFVDFAAKIFATLNHAAHFITNVSIEVDGDRGFSECYYLAHHRRKATDDVGEQDVFFEGRYIDLFERREGVWKIIKRRGLSDLVTKPSPAPSAFADWPAGQHSTRDRDDEYYAMRAEFLGG